MDTYFSSFVKVTVSLASLICNFCRLPTQVAINPARIFFSFTKSTSSSFRSCPGRSRNAQNGGWCFLSSSIFKFSTVFQVRAPYSFSFSFSLRVSFSFLTLWSYGVSRERNRRIHKEMKGKIRTINYKRTGPWTQHDRYPTLKKINKNRNSIQLNLSSQPVDASKKEVGQREGKGKKRRGHRRSKLHSINKKKDNNLEGPIEGTRRKNKSRSKESKRKHRHRHPRKQDDKASKEVHVILPATSFPEVVAVVVAQTENIHQTLLTSIEVIINFILLFYFYNKF